MRKMKDSGIAWLGGIPSNWNVAKGKRALKPLQRPIRDDDQIITCFRDGEVTLRANRRTEGFTVALKEVGYQGIEPGDLVVHSMDGFAGSIGISDSRGKASPVLNVLDSCHNKKYLMYYLRALAFREVYLALADGIRVRSCNLSWKKIASLPILLPSMEEQQRIADYLDAKCGEIDRAIEAAEKSIEDYEAYRDAVIFFATTKGLNPNCMFQDGNLEWLGKVPSSWSFRRWKYLLRERVEKNNPIRFETILSLSAAQGVVPYSERKGGGNKSKADLSEYKIARKGDIVLNSMNVVSGSVALSDYDGCVSPVYYMYYPATREVDIRYYSWLFKSSRFQRSLFGLGNGIMYKESGNGKLNTVRMRISSQVLGSLKLPFPPITEQAKIAEHLDSTCSTIDSLIAIKRSVIEEIKAYKQSLIYEVVTGKREV